MPGKAKRVSLGRYCVTSFYIHAIDRRYFTAAEKASIGFY